MANQIITDQSGLVEHDAKKAYMEHVYGMTHGQLFHELMRVHTESAKLIQSMTEKVEQMEKTIEELKNEPGTSVPDAGSVL